MIKIYKKQEQKPQIWKAAIAVFVGLSSLSLTWTLFDEPVQIAVLPLGLWVLLVILRHRGSWVTYRKFAWLGFFANYLFVLSFLLNHLLSSFFYPADELSTYLDDVKDAQLLAIHPSAQASPKLHLPQSFEGIIAVPSESYDVFDWYNEIVFEQTTPVQEKFPYLLLDTQAKQGSGIQPTIFVEANGKGLLVINKGKQFYFYLKDSMIGGVKTDD